MMRRAIVMAFLWIGCSYAANVPLVTFPAALGGVIEIKAAVVDSAGNIYVTGVATKGLPVTSGVLQPALNLGALCFQPDSTDCTDAFVAKFSPAGQLIYATYLGGSADDGGTAIAVDNAGNAYVTGYTYSHDFPLTANAFQKTNAGPPFSGCCQTNPEPGDDAFVAKLNSTGTALIYSTFLGGSGVDVAHAIQVDSQQNSYVAGQTDSTNFPVTPGTYSQKTFGLFSGFVTKINAAGRLAYSTYFDAGVSAIALDASGSVYLTGTANSGFSATPGAFQTLRRGQSDAFAAKLTPEGARSYATLLGGGDVEYGLGIAVDQAGDAWIVGSTQSLDFPTSVQLPDQHGGAFVARINSAGSALVFSSRMGSHTSDFFFGQASVVAIDADGNAVIAGIANTPYTTADAFEKRFCSSLFAGGFSETGGNFMAKWSPSGTLLYASLLREGEAVAVDAAGDVYLKVFLPTGITLARFDPAARPLTASFACVLNAASFGIASGGISPGEIVSLFGDRIGPDTPAKFQIDSSGKFATEIGNTRVLFDGIPAPLLYAQDNQINAIVPWELKSGSIDLPAQFVYTNIVIERNGIANSPVPALVVASDPGIFRLDSEPYGQGAILNQDGTVNSKKNPAQRGSVISIFATGTGPLAPIPGDGEIVADASRRVAMVIEAVFHPQLEAEVLYAGAAPTLVAGLTQINVRIPKEVPDDAVVNGAKVYVRLDHRYACFEVTVAVK